MFSYVLTVVCVYDILTY